jgi:hypothetical protein
VGLALAGLLTLPAVAQAAFPQDPPNDPGYAPAEEPGACTTTSVNDEQRFLFSFMPQCAPNASDPENASGMSVDAAWRDFTIGRGDTVIAYVEGGINWRNSSIRELVDRVFLNKGELPPPTTPDDDPGTLNAQDYRKTADGEDMPDANGNGFVDPEDILVEFSDGKDDDHNGYTDDISGWDFYDDQNDPGTVDSEYGHANSQQEEAAAETNNGFSEAGICPKCMIMPVKAGAEALDRTDELAQAWLYAADMNADVIVSVTADLGFSSFMRQAVEHVWRKGAVMAESSNDFDSTDHQGGMFWPHVLPGNSVVGNAEGVPNAVAANNATTTYRQRSGETSWGTHNVFSVARRGGSTSESTPTVGGVMALVLAYGKDAADQHHISEPLTNDEAIQVVRATASDIDDSSLAWPSKPGWDLQYGYGRPNIHKAMQAIHDGDIPPVGWIDSPDWYALYDPTATDEVKVKGHVDAPRSKSYSWKLEYALGPEPSDDDFTEIGSGDDSKAFDGSLGTLDLSDIPEDFWAKEFELSQTKTLETSELYTVTLRLRVTDADGRVGEDRRSIAVQHDPSWLKGFPKRIGPGGEAQTALVDLQGKGRLAAVFGDSDGVVHAVDGKTGEELHGWPVKTNPTKVTHEHRGIDPGHEPVLDNLAVGDLDHDGELSVVAVSTAGRVYVWDARGKARKGWPKALDSGVEKPDFPRPDLPFTRLPHQGATAPPVLYDLDGDDKLEIIQAGWDGRIHVWRPDGSKLPGWPVEVKLPDGHSSPPGRDKLISDHKLITPPSVADLDGDGKPELLIRSQWAHIVDGGIQPGGVGHVHAYHADGQPVDGYPIEQQSIVMYYGSAQEFVTEGSTVPSVADVDGDGKDEFAEGPIFTPTSLWNGDGSQHTTYGSTSNAVTAFSQVAANPLSVIQGDLPADEPVTFTASGAFGRFGPGGQLAFAQPGVGSASIAASLLVVGSGHAIRNVIRANNAESGAALPGFAAEIQGLDFLGAPAFADVTGDGQAELLVGADSSALHAFDFEGDQADGFPKFQTGWVVFAPSTGDLDSDGKTDVVVMTREGYLMAWGTDGTHEGDQEWWSSRHDEHNTSRYGEDTRPPGVVGHLRLRDGGRRIAFTAPGDDWYGGEVDHYLIRLYGGGGSATIEPHATGPAGTKEDIALDGATSRVKVQAVDDAGNIGPVSVVRAGG